MTEIPQPESGQDWKRFRESPQRPRLSSYRRGAQTPRGAIRGAGERGAPWLVRFRSLTGVLPPATACSVQPRGGVHPSAGFILNSSLTIYFKKVILDLDTLLGGKCKLQNSEHRIMIFVLNDKYIRGLVRARGRGYAPTISDPLGKQV